MGVITTFYSYKGGVGRTMALANIAVLLAKRDKKVLLVDWDLEAPGLHKYFKDLTKKPAEMRCGLMGLLKAAVDKKNKPHWPDYVEKIELSKDHKLDVIWSGCEGIEDYITDVLSFDWNKFYSEYGGGRFIEDLRNEWKEQYDFVFVDSRTGITDYGGICTIQLPDFLTLVFTSNEQNMEGVKDYAIRAQKARQGLAYDRMPMLILPLLSHFDSKEEKKRGELWLKKISKEMTQFYTDWLPKDFSILQVLENTKLPYVPYFSFGEELAVEKTSLTDPDTLGYAYNRIANILEKYFQDVPTILGLSGDREKRQAFEYFAKGEYQKAEEMLKRALEINEKLGRLEGVASNYGNLGVFYRIKREFDKAEEMHKKSLEISERLGLLEGVAINYSNLGVIYQTRGELDKAEEVLKRALEINEKKPGLFFEEVAANQYGNLGMIYQKRGALDKAEEMLKRSLEISEKLGRLEGMAIQYGNLGAVYKQRGDLRRAREYWEKSRDLFKKIGVANEVKRVEGWIEGIKGK